MTAPDELAATEWGDEKGVRATLRAMRLLVAGLRLALSHLRPPDRLRVLPLLLGLVRERSTSGLPSGQPVSSVSRTSSTTSSSESGREIANVLKLTYMGFVTGVIAPFVMAELIFSIRETVSKEIYRFAIVIPMLVPGVVYASMAAHLRPNLGPINSFLRGVGRQPLRSQLAG